MSEPHKGFVIIDESEYDNPDVTGMFDTFEDALTAAFEERVPEDERGEWPTMHDWYYQMDGLWIGRYHVRVG
jgi:hypothetical protein